MTAHSRGPINDLLPCPFCGHEEPARAHRFRSSLTGPDRKWDQISCNYCDAIVTGDNEQEAANAWNTRAITVEQATRAEGGEEVAQSLADENIRLRKRLTKIHVMVLEGILAELETEDFGMTEALRPELERLHGLLRGTKERV